MKELTKAQQRAKALLSVGPLHRSKQEWIDKAKEAKTGFHWRDGWFFKRMPDGTVRVSESRGESLSRQFTIPAPEWASIVCSVSALGETGDRWEAAQDFHGRSDIPRCQAFDVPMGTGSALSEAGESNG